MQSSPVASLLANLTHRSNLILDADYIEKYGMDLGLTVESVNGTGPYKLKYWDRDQEMVFEAFPDYFRGEVPTKNIDILIVSDANARVVALETGQVDISTVNSSEIPRLKETPGIQVKTFEGIGAHGLQFNCANEYMKDPRVRQAIVYAIDKQLIVDVLYSDIGEKAATAPVNSNVWGYYDFGVIPQDIEKSKALLAEAGYPDGFDISIMLYPNYNKSTETFEMVVAMLAEVGINATIETLERTSHGQCSSWASVQELRTVMKDSGESGQHHRTETTTITTAGIPTPRLTDFLQRVFTNDRYNIWTMSDKVEGFDVNVNNVIFWDNLRCKN